MGCSPVDLPDTCAFCDDDAEGLIVQLYINFPDQGPFESYGITLEYGNENDGFDIYTNDFYDNGSTIQFFVDDSLIIYLTEVVCPNGDIDTTDLGDTVYYFVTREPTFNQLGPVVEACDSIGLPPIEGLYVPPDAAYYTGSGGNGSQFMPGDWLTESGIYYIYGTNGPCVGEIAFELVILDGGDASWTPADYACAGQPANQIFLQPDGDPSGT